MFLDTIKLIIWDLDDTFWKGTISEERVKIVEDNLLLINHTLDMGIMHSICSKNDYEVVRKTLQEMKMWECFVFVSIDWTPKGSRISNIIKTMKLRPENVLFIDDNLQNLEEAKYCCTGIQVMHASDLPKLYNEAYNATKKDKNRKRLKQYQQLERTEIARSEYESNEEFLRSCKITVTIDHDCMKEVERIYELVLRTNQLNYTKYRSTKEELVTLLEDKSVLSGYVSVQDKFGDYGIVGFFAEKDNKLIHFVFSCRTLGMRIEQYVYYMLGCPEIEIKGSVSTELNNTENPDWINNYLLDEKDPKPEKEENNTGLFLLKGPCDLSQMYAFLGNSNNITTEFTYTNAKGIIVEGHNHTSQIVTSLFANSERKIEIIDEIPFSDQDMLTTCLLTKTFDVVILSMLPDGNLGIYRRKKTGEEIALCEKKYNLVDSSWWEDYISGRIYTSDIHFTKEMLNSFSERYEYVSNENGEVTINNLQKIWEYIDEKSILVLLLGSEREYTGKTIPSYVGRHTEHQRINSAIREWSKDKENVKLICFDQYIHSENDFIDTINHFTKRVYYDLAKDLVELLHNYSASDIEIKGKKTLYYSTIKQIGREMKRRIKGIGHK